MAGSGAWWLRAGAGPAVLLVMMAVVWTVARDGDGRVVAQDTPTVQVAQIDGVGAVLTDADGMSLYVFDPDGPNESVCTDGCAEVWPPLVLDEGDPIAPADLGGTLSTFTRADGRRQVAYNERPLYRYAGDQQPGDVRGDGIDGIWHLARPETGAAAQASPTPAPTSAPTPTPTPSPAPTPVATFVAPPPPPPPASPPPPPAGPYYPY